MFSAVAAYVRDDTMPSQTQRAILLDIEAAGLDPKKKYTRCGSDGRIASPAQPPLPAIDAVSLVAQNEPQKEEAEPPKDDIHVIAHVDEAESVAKRPRGKKQHSD